MADVEKFADETPEDLTTGDLEVFHNEAHPDLKDSADSLAVDDAVISLSEAKTTLRYVKELQTTCGEGAP